MARPPETGRRGRCSLGADHGPVGSQGDTGAAAVEKFLGCQKRFRPCTERVGGEMAQNESERQRWNDEIWASVWPRREQLTDQVTPLLLEALALQTGERVLEVGCGGGKVALAAASLVGPSGSVVGADLSRPLLALAERRRAELGVTNLSFAEGDAQVASFTDEPGGKAGAKGGDVGRAGAFDAAMSQFGVMFFDEPVTAFSNIGAQLVPDGRLCFACWQPLDRNPWFPGVALAPFVAPPPPPAEGKSAGGPFAFGDPDRVVEILSAAGFREISREPHDLVAEAGADAIVDDAQLEYLGVRSEEMDSARETVDRHVAQFASVGGTYRFPLAVQIFTARR